MADIVASLARAEREGVLRGRVRFPCRASRLIVDETGHLPVGAENLFLQLVNAHDARGAMILTSNRGLAEWGEVFGAPAVATALFDRHAGGRSCRDRLTRSQVPGCKKSCRR